MRLVKNIKDARNTFGAVVHHSNRDAQEAIAELNVRARDRFDSIIKDGQLQATSMLTKLQDEIPEDRVVDTTGVDFSVSPEGRLMVNVGNNQFGLHANARSQLVGRLGGMMTNTNVDKMILQEGWGPELLTHNLRTIYQNTRDRVLLRSVKGEIRGWLSDSYRRLDTHDLMAAFIEAAQPTGAVPIMANGTDTWFQIRMISPKIWEPVPGDLCLFGLSLRTSDYGCANVEVSLFCMRFWCTNYAMAESMLKQVHLGGKLPDNIAWSEATMRLDTKTMVSAMRDVVTAGLLPEKLEAQMLTIRRAYEEEIKPKTEMSHLPLIGKEKLRLAELYNTPDVELLPPGNSRWRLAQAVSLLGQKSTNRDRELELEGLAWKIATKK